MIRADVLIADADVVATCVGPAPKAGATQGDIAAVPRASVAGLDGRVVAVGPAGELARSVALTADAIVVDGRGHTVVPGFVDSHTHLVYGGDRRDELARRLRGATYAEIAAGGGGIVRTVADTRHASEDALVAAALPRLADALAQGTTTCEVKSGYGLDTATELKMLRAIRRLRDLQPVAIAATAVHLAAGRLDLLLGTLLGVLLLIGWTLGRRLATRLPVRRLQQLVAAALIAAGAAYL